jgi:hypothetical protein
MEIKNLGKVTKCMNPETDCPNIPDPASSYVVVYRNTPLVLCKQCGPEFQRKAILEKRS